ncbi:MAG: exonuclease [Caudoviricetes sp.]|nr:MAG: exonuclease [Caudoviricetes sp.]
MKEILIRCSSLGKIMTEPKTKAEGILSVGAKTYIRELAQQEIFGIDFEFSSKETEKGLEVENESIALLNRVRGLALTKNSERRSNGLITGECDLYDAERKRGHDLKSSWSSKTFPGWVKDCEDKLYEWQCRGYMLLWDADEWEVNYALVDTPERLIGYEPLQMHIVSHIAEHHRLTSWIIKRDADKEHAIKEKVEAARDYYREAIKEFDQHHMPAQELATS